MDAPMTPLPAKLKKAAEDAFHNNDLLANISPEDRLIAADWYEMFAGEAGGSRAGLARLYNLERAAFLRGQVKRIARDAPLFAEDIGYG